VGHGQRQAFGKVADVQNFCLVGLIQLKGAAGALRTLKPAKNSP